MKQSKKDSIETKAQKECPEFVAEVSGLSLEQLEHRFSELGKGEAENDILKDEDEDLEAARAEVANLSAPYREAKKALKVKQRFLISLMKNKANK